MDKYITQSINSRKEAISNTYEIGTKEKKEIDALFSEIEKLGFKCKDVGEFESEFAKSPLNQQYLDLFTTIATNVPVKSSVVSNAKAATPATVPDLGKMVAKGAVEGALDNAATQAKNAVLPTNAAIHQKIHDETQKIPVLGDAIDIGQKASYVTHLGKLFSKRKKKNS